MSSHIDQARVPTDAVASRAIWTKRLLIALTIVSWIAIGCFLLFVIWLIGEAFTLVLVAALLAYIIFPFVTFFQRFMPRVLAVVLVYLVVLVALSVLLFLVGVSFVQQLGALVTLIQHLLSPEGQQRIQPFLDFLQRFGVTREQFTGFGDQFVAQMQSLFAGALPFVGGVFSWIILVVTIATLSIYFILDGKRIINWLHVKTPLKYRDPIGFLLRTADRAGGGYFRGLLILAIIAGIGAGLFLQIVGNSFAVLLGVVSFALFFIPIIGGFVAGLLCIIFALPQGWETALIVGIYIIILQVVILGLILEPRIFHSTVGVHPILVLFAIFAGLERFGILGALLAVPVTGLVQEIVIAYWKRYQIRHPDQFPAVEAPLVQPEHAAEPHTEMVPDT